MKRYLKLVKLYEKMLPLAMLFGIEKQWSKQFTELQKQPPDWYRGNWNGYNAALFASSFSSFSSVTAANFAPLASSGSSGFSGGGGFSVGGGGGGGEGGW